MTHTFSPRYFHKVSTVSFSGNSLWEDLVVLKRTVVAALPLSLYLPSSYHFRWFSFKGHSRSSWLCTDGWVHWSGLNLVSSSLFQFPVCLFFHGAMFISNSILPLVSIHCPLSLLNFYFMEGHWVVYHHHHFHLLASSLGLLFWQSSVITFPVLFLIS